MELVELADADDFEKEKYVPRIGIVEGSSLVRLMTYFKEQINTFVYKNPEAVFGLHLSGGNFP